MKAREAKCDYEDKRWGIAPITNLMTDFQGFEINFFVHYVQKHLEGKKVRLLDLGCGGGSVAGYLKKKFPKWEVSGLDVSHTVLLSAKKTFPKVKFIEAPAQKIPARDNFYDIVISLDSLEHFKNIEQVLLEVRRVCRNEGIFYIGVPIEKQKPTLYWLFKNGRENIKKMVGHINSFDDGEFQNLMNSHNFVLIARKFTCHLILSVVNLCYDFFQLTINKHIAFESEVFKMKKSPQKTFLAFAKKLLSFIFYLESSLFYWFPGGKGLYLYRCQK